MLTKAIGDGGPARFVDRIETDVVLINSNPAAMSTEPCQSKFFFGDHADREAQVFVNFDLPGGVAVFREKDFDYRANLLRALVVQ